MSLKPEDVKPAEMLHKFLPDGEYLPIPAVPAYEVGAIIKAAMESATAAALNISNQFADPKKQLRSANEVESWLAKAEELEAMK